MSKQQTLARVLRDVKTMSEDELFNIYGIEITEEEIYDPVMDLSFETLKEWAEAYAETEEDDEEYTLYKKKPHRNQFDDEYY